MAVCDKFLTFAGDRSLSQWNGSLANEFLDQLRAEGYAPGTIRWAYSIVKRTYDAAKAVYEQDRIQAIANVNPNDTSAVAEILKVLSLPGPTWSLGKRSSPRVSSIDVVKPALTNEEVQDMVKVAKEGKLGPDGAAFLAVASVYGLRREELVRIRPDDIEYERKTIYIRTCKGGEERNQLLAEALIPYIRRHDFSRQYSLFKLSELYRKVEQEAGIEHRDGAGWHSYRRYLNTALRDLCGELETKIFLRWRLSASSEMVERYYTKNPLDTDRFVLEHHPVLEIWRE